MTPILLIEALGDIQPEVRMAAISALKERNEERVRDALIDALSDSDAVVRGRAAQVLERHRWRPTNRKEEMWSAIARGDLAQAATHGAGAIEAL